MACIKCGSEHIILISAKCDDRCFVHYNDTQTIDYVPTDLGIGGGSYIKFNYCGSCGTIQHDFPLSVFADPEPEVQSEVDTIKYVMLDTLINAFEHAAYNTQPNYISRNDTNSKFRTVLKYLTPSEQEAVNHHFMMFNEMLRLQQEYKEFPEYIQHLRERYANVQVVETLMMI